jgi:hypothetical protein
MAPATFSGEELVFFRGTACTQMEVQSGASIPVTLATCLHPCVQVLSHRRVHYYECIGSSCDAWAVFWVVADSAAGGCPADAFGEFAKDQCQYPVSVELSIDTTLESGPIEGFMTLEIPFLTNADLHSVLADYPNDAVPPPSAFEPKILQYKRLDNRVVGGKPISLLDGNPPPPPMCEGSTNCPCFEIGF